MLGGEKFSWRGGVEKLSGGGRLRNFRKGLGFYWEGLGNFREGLRFFREGLIFFHDGLEYSGGVEI